MQQSSKGGLPGVEAALHGEMHCTAARELKETTGKTGNKVLCSASLERTAASLQGEMHCISPCRAAKPLPAVSDYMQQQYKTCS
jgi:hypothetical protein